MHSPALLRSAAAATLLALAAPLSAATLHEQDMPGGAFSPLWSEPTEVGAGVSAVAGTGSQNVFDNFLFTGLAAGAQQIVLDFLAPGPVGDSYSAGLTVFYKFTPFLWGWDGTQLGTVQLYPHHSTDRLTLDLGEGFAGDLHLALNFTHGEMAYNIALPGSSTPAPVPLPAGMLLLGTALGGLGFAARRRRKPADG
ncbi:MAG: VPLPA-CTERM sorting domain-containing protein [Gemmobacter sp.]